MSLPREVREGVEAVAGPVVEQGAVGGGCIQPAVRLRAGTHDLFLKYGRGTPPDFFTVEAEGLRQIGAATRDLRVPAVIGQEDVSRDDGYGWLLLEWLEPGRRAADFGSRLGEGLAELHEQRVAGWGWERDGFIGTLEQPNGVVQTWAEFWRLRRLEPQLELARRSRRVPGLERDWQRLLDLLPSLLAEGDEDGASLLHGDLWDGNILAVAGGDAAIVDPAAYRGHGEVDLAMSELFGGLDSTFFEAYEARRPLRPGYPECRRGIYQLYYLLVHVNLFGSAYAEATVRTLRSVLAQR